jgi:hypothetical protein
VISRVLNAMPLQKFLAHFACDHYTRECVKLVEEQNARLARGELKQATQIAGPLS